MRTWKVIWLTAEGRKTFRKFEGAKPSEAVQFAKRLKQEGLKPNVVSANKAFPPTKEQQDNRRPNQVWCPYCVKWRTFKLMAIRRKSYVTDAVMRCPVCTISTNDFFVRKYNGFLEHMDEAELIKKLMRLEANG